MVVEPSGAARKALLAVARPDAPAHPAAPAHPGAPARRLAALAAAALSVCEAVAAALSAAACAPAAGPVEPPAPAFPTDAELARIAFEPADRAVVAAHAVIVDAWDLAGPLTDRIDTARHRSDTPWFAVLERAIAGRPRVSATRAMHCAAREVGLFALAHRSRPAPGLLQFMTSRCGSPAVDLVASFALVRDDATRTTEQLWAAWEPTLARMLSTVGDREREVGIWLGRDGTSAAMAVVSGAVKVRLARADRVPDASGHIVIEGRVLRPTRALDALMTAGRYGVGSCVADASLALPRFRLTCAPDRADAVAWVDVAAIEPDSRLGRGALKLLVWPRGQPPARYVRPVYAAPRRVMADDGDARVALASLINDVRASAGLGPLRLARAQSELTTRLVAHYFEALYDPARQRRLDTIALGLMAGHRVQERVRHGWLGAALIGGGDLGALVDAALEGPFGRQSLLGADAGVLALGLLYESRTETLAAMFASYAVADPARDDGGALASRLMGELAGRRAAAGAAAPRALGRVDDLLAGARRSIEGGEAPEAALGRAVERARLRWGPDIRGWVVYDAELDGFEFPGPLVTDPAVAAALAVAVHRPRGAAWASYAVLILARLTNG